MKTPWAYWWMAMPAVELWTAKVDIQSSTQRKQLVTIKSWDKTKCSRQSQVTPLRSSHHATLSHWFTSIFYVCLKKKTFKEHNIIPFFANLIKLVCGLFALCQSYDDRGHQELPSILNQYRGIELGCVVQ